VTSALEDDGHSVVALPVNVDLPHNLGEAAPALVFNTYFGPARRQDQAYVASLLEYAGVAFTGGGAACHFVGLSKPLSKRLFEGAGLPTPRFVVVSKAAQAIEALEAGQLRFPLIVKLPEEGEGIGIDERSVVRAPEQLGPAVERLVSGFARPAMVEEFLPGREFTVGVLDGRFPRVLPILEIALGPGRTYSFEAKLEDLVAEICPAAVSEGDAKLMGRLAVQAGRELNCRDYWRVDFRMDSTGRPCIMEVNTLPGLQPGYSDMTKMADPAGIGYGGLVLEIVESARVRATE
jgi:D-alanine-D-alanine ligase